MTTWNVQIQFDADTDDDARAILETWQLSDGAVVSMIVGTTHLTEHPLPVAAPPAPVIDEDGAEPEAPPGD